jgi:isocitrate dehydrogenase kinase/phosphatase
VARPADEAVRLIADSYHDLESGFAEITARAPDRFERREWHLLVADVLERLGLYGPAADGCAGRIVESLGDASLERDIWMAAKDAYRRLSDGRSDSGLAKTFYNSVTRRVLQITGVDERTQFLADELDDPLRTPFEIFQRHQVTTDLETVIVEILEACEFAAPFRRMPDDARLVTERIAGELADGESIVSVDVAKPVFYRGKGAYLVGRVNTDNKTFPLALALVHKKEGIGVDAVLTAENDLSILFSFAHSYFDVDINHPHHLVAFINELVPRKRHSELFISLGRVRHGKTELYRELFSTLASTDDPFVEPPGMRGLVMAVFTLPGLEMVFKVIRDSIPAQKSLTPGQVMEKYRLVYRHDRAGRLVDSQSFERLQLPVHRFDTRLLSELVTDCSRSVRLEGDQVEIDLAYMQRRVTPLDVYVKEAGADKASAAVVEYGNAIRDLAVTGIFPGDLLLKNFGVTRNERVVFYDYDELTELTNLHFREMPETDDAEHVMSATPWFPLGPDDVFPSEFRSFLGLTPDLLGVFLEHHSHLLEASWWKRVQTRIAGGDVVSIYPYSADLRL